MVRAVYYLESDLDPAYAAEQVAKEQSAGHSRSWQGISHESQLAGRADVVEVTEIPPAGPALPVTLSAPVDVCTGSRRAARVVIDYQNWQPEDGLVSLMNVLCGEPQHLGIIGALRLEGIDLDGIRGPQFPGPPFGLEWFTRDMPSQAQALICAPLKPSAGLLPDEAAKLAYEAAMGGATIIKDDELAFSTQRSSSVARAERVADEVRGAEQNSGERKIYIANAIGPGYDLIERSRSLIRAGADALLVAPAIQGQDVVTTLRMHGIPCPLVVHNAVQTNASRLRTFGISFAVWITLQRLSGADGIVLPSGLGSFGFSADETRSFVESCVQKVPDIRASLAMHSGAVSVVNVARLIALNDDALIALTSGTGIFDHPAGARAGAESLRALVDFDWKEASGNRWHADHSLRVARENSRDWKTTGER